MILVYPVITMNEKTHSGSKANLLGRDPKPEPLDLFSNEKQVTAKTPPTFLAHAQDDTVVRRTTAKFFSRHCSLIRWLPSTCNCPAEATDSTATRGQCGTHGRQSHWSGSRSRR